MKKVLLFITMAAALLFTQCKKEVSVPSAGKTVSMTVTAGPGSKTDITENGAITWSTGDKLYVGDGEKYIGYLTLVGEGGSATGAFTGNVTLGEDVTGEKSFGFFYLGSNPPEVASSATSVDVEFDNQTGLLGNLGSCHVGYGSAKGTVIGGAVTDINVMLVSKVAIARFSFTKDSNPYTDALTLSGDNICNKMTVNFNSEVFACTGTKGEISLTNTMSSEKYVMLVPTDGTATSQTLTFAGEYVSGGTAILENGIKPNKFYGLNGAIAVTLTPTTIPVTSVTLDKTTLSLIVGEEKNLNATVHPDNATNPSVTWSSGNEDVATVDQDGLVAAVGVGSTTITVTAVDDDSKFAKCTVTVTAPLPPCLPGEFSVSASTKVKFSRGNLYYDGSVFHFETNQWGTQPASDGQWVSNHVSHFKWSPDKDVAVSTSTSVSGGTDDVFFTNATETTASSSFQVAGETAGTWRTLSNGEWSYLLNTSGSSSSGRTDANRFAKAKVNGVCGLLIFPDGYTLPEGYTTTDGGTGMAKVNKTSSSDAPWPTADIPTEKWTLMESSGAVFLPAAGSRNVAGVARVGLGGYYWSSAPYDEGGAFYMYFDSSSVYTSWDYRRIGFAVRLVR